MLMHRRYLTREERIEIRRRIDKVQRAKVSSTSHGAFFINEATTATRLSSKKRPSQERVACHIIVGDGEPRSLVLGNKEAMIYNILVDNPFDVVTVDRLAEAVDEPPAYVRTLVYTLRRKLRAEGLTGIETIRYQGYRLDTLSPLL